MDGSEEKHRLWMVRLRKRAYRVRLIMKTLLSLLIPNATYQVPHSSYTVPTRILLIGMKTSLTA